MNDGINRESILSKRIDSLMNSGATLARGKLPRNTHAAHKALVEAYEAEHPTGDKLLYVSRPGDGNVRYVWTSGVRVGLAASMTHLAWLMAGGDPDESPR